MVGFAFVWFSRVATTAGNATQAQLEAELSRQSKRISIDNVDALAAQITVRNIGSQIVASSDIALFVNGALVTCASSPWTPLSIAPGSTSSCDWSASSCTAGTRVRVTAPGNFDEVTC